MADQDDPKHRWPPANRPTGGRPADPSGEADPLVELARIVSGSPQDGTARRAAPSAEAGRSSSRDLARDLEAELLENLQASFDAIRDPLDPQYPHDTTASEPEVEGLTECVDADGLVLRNAGDLELGRYIWLDLDLPDGEEVRALGEVLPRRDAASLALDIKFKHLFPDQRRRLLHALEASR